MYKKIKVKNKDIMLYCENIDKLEELPIVVYHSYTPNIDEFINIKFEMNEGNHFKDANLRLAKGIKEIL